MSGELKIIPTFLPNKSITLNKPEEFLKNQYSTENSRNMEFYNDYLQGRLGLLKLDTTVLSGPVLLMDQFWKFTGDWFFLVCTTKDIYSYTFAVGTGTAGYFTILTPTYTTGTIAVDGTGATPTIVTGSGGVTDFSVAGVKAGDFLKVGTGTPLAADTWYEIDSVDSTTQVTLTAAGPSVVDSQFTIRKCYAGSSTDFWNSRTFIDKNDGDTWLATNGVDVPVKWHGSGQMLCIDTSGIATLTAAKYVEVYNDRAMLLWTKEGGANQPQRLRWSAVADCDDWTSTDYHDFMDDGYWITGTGIMASSHVVFRERDAYLGRYVGGDYTFSYDKSSSCAGVWSPNSLVLFEREAFYYGPDNKFHCWDMLSDRVISEAIFPRAKDYNPTLEQYIYGWEVESKNQIRWFTPYSDTSYNNECVVYDYIQEIMQIWNYGQAQACCSIGEYLNTEDLYMDDLTWGEYYLDEHEGFFDDRVFLANAPIIVYGGYDGYLRKADIGYDDDGTAYTRTFESIRDNFRLPHQNKRLYKQQFWLQADSTGSITVSLQKDDSNTYESTTNSISIIDADRDIIKKNITWNKHGENFKTKIEATNHFSLLGYLNYIFTKAKTIR